LNGSSEPVDVVTVADELRRNNLLDDLGGIDALLELQNTTPAISSADRYARIIRDTARLRRLISVASDIAEIAYTEPDDVSKAIDEAESKVYAIGNETARDSLVSLSPLISETMDHITAASENGSAITGLASGFLELDRILSGLQPSTLNIVGARPAMGKSAFAMGLAVNAAQNQNLPVIFFSLEMGRGELANRIIASEARVNSTKLRTGQLDPNDWSRIGRAINRLDVPLFIDDNSAVTVPEIRARVRRLVAKHGGVALVVIDYLQLMGGDASVENRQLEVSEISRGLKLLAREFNIPVVALSQLSRGLENRQEKRPQLADLRESGALEQDADVVMFLYRPEVYDRDNVQLKGEAEVIVAKHRAGPIGSAKLVFQSDFTRFENAARREI
jgi:replicative DNA helicase